MDSCSSTRGVFVRQARLYLARAQQTTTLADRTYQERFYGLTENRREIDMDMREMVDKVKKGEPLYGRSSLSEHMQGVAARNSRYTGLFLYAIPWFNFVNHPYVRHPSYFTPIIAALETVNIFQDTVQEC